MKRVFIAVLVVCGVLLTWIVYQFLNINFQSQAPAITTDSAPTPIPVQPAPTITDGGVVYAYSFVKVATATAITLIPNFSIKRDARSLAAENSCREAINGGFYDTAGKPLGFFYANKRTYGAKLSSALVNGFFWADIDGGALISSDLPLTAYRFAIQTGPLLLFNGQTIPLSVQADEHARRMVVGKTSDNQFVFLAVYSADSVYSGPLLADLPSVIGSISAKEKLGIADALNLDGGSASAFYNGKTSLSELTPVGSLFCIQ